MAVYFPPKNNSSTPFIFVRLTVVKKLKTNFDSFHFLVTGNDRKNKLVTRCFIVGRVIYLGQDGDKDFVYRSGYFLIAGVGSYFMIKDSYSLS